MREPVEIVRALLDLHHRLRALPDCANDAALIADVLCLMVPGPVRAAGPVPARGPVVASAADATRGYSGDGHCASLVRRAFAAAYEQALAVPWGDGGFGAEITRVAGWLARSGEPEKVIARAVAGFFADSWAQEHRYPFGAFAKDPGKYTAMPPVRRSAEDIAEARRKLRAEYDRRHQAARNEAEQAEALAWWSEQMARLAA